MPCKFVYRESCLTGTHFEECQLQFFTGPNISPNLFSSSMVYALKRKCEWITHMYISFGCAWNR